MSNQDKTPQCPQCGFTIFSPLYQTCQKCGASLLAEKRTLTAEPVAETDLEPLKQERARIQAHIEKLRREMQSGVNPSAPHKLKVECDEANQTADDIFKPLERTAQHIEQIPKNVEHGIFFKIVEGAIKLIFALIGLGIAFILLMWLIFYILCSR